MRQIYKIIFLFSTLVCLNTNLISQTGLKDLASKESEGRYLEPLKNEITPKTTIFAFDLHEVLFQKKINSMVLNCLKVLAKGMIWYTFNPFFWCKLRKICSQDLIAEDAFKQIVSEYPGIGKFEKDYYEIATSYEPVLPMIKILKELKDKGYKLFLLSNIGEETYKRHSKKFPEIMGYFDGMYIPSSKINYMHKPDVEFYRAFKNYLKERNFDQMQIIFIDDIKENVDSALLLDIACIHFTSVEQFSAILDFLKAR